MNSYVAIVSRKEVISMTRFKLNERHFENHSQNVKRKKYRVVELDTPANKASSSRLKPIRAVSYKRKAKKTGNSIQVTIPSEIVKELNIAPGDNIIYKNNEAGDIVIEKEKMIPEKLGVSEEFLRILDEGMTEYHEVLENLVER